MRPNECWTNYRPLNLDQKEPMWLDIIGAIVAMPVIYVLLIIFFIIIGKKS